MVNTNETQTKTGFPKQESKMNETLAEAITSIHITSSPQ